jgi:Zn-dependent protease with chaperone function
MRYYMLLGLVTAAGFAVTATAASLLLGWTWPRLRAAALPTATARARRLALLRLTPFTAGLAASLVLALNFLRYEPRTTTEEPGLLLLLGAALAVALAAAAAGRIASAAQTVWQCRRLVRECGTRCAGPGGQPVWIIDSQYPVAAVMGVLSTRVLLSRRILSECTAAEVASVVRHEIAHIERLDNLVQAAMRFLPDPLAHTATGRAIQKAWAEAAEEAADDLAAQDPAGRTDLASALVRVAGMADRQPPRWIPALTFFEPATVESRVRRLLMSEPSATGSLRWVPTALLACCGAVLVSTEAFGLRLHALMELAVRALP